MQNVAGVKKGVDPSVRLRKMNSVLAQRGMWDTVSSISECQM